MSDLLRTGRRCQVFWVAFVMLPALGWVPSAAAEQPALTLGLYGQAGTEAWSNGLPVLAMDGTWSRGYTPRAGAQRAYQTADVEVGVVVGHTSPDEGAPVGRGWRLGWATRAQAQVKLSGDAAQLVYHYQSQSDPAAPQALDSQATVQWWWGQGLALHTPVWQAGAWQLSGGVQYLSLKRLRRIDTSGTTRYDGLGQYTYAMDLLDADSQRQAAFLSPPADTGRGATLNVALQWQPTPTWRAVLALDDVWSRLQWRGVNVDTAVLNSEVATRTPDGYIDYQAAIHGRHTSTTVVERIPMTVRASVYWQRPEGDWFVHLQDRWGLQQGWLGLARGQDLRWHVALEPRAQAAQLGLQWRGWCLQAGADRLDGAAHVRQLNLAYQWGEGRCLSMGG